ncbi:shikimate dehydrogenase [Crocosphaera sp. Alani8]|uniref:shikimate dehydrogenase n=1 Tax=Crocosphaera sp. Alani8 TaxID=3038952 RepID=UPI00313A9D3C
MNEPVTVSFDLADILIRIEDKLDKQSEEIGDIKVKLTAVDTDVKNLKEDVRDMKIVQNTLVKEVSDLKGFRSLILPLIVGGVSAVIGGIVTAVLRLPALLLKP